MDEIYSLLITLDFPDSLTYNLRKKTDFVRNLTEKTRGDITLATSRLQLVETIKSIIDTNENDTV
jgi:translin